MIFCNISNTVHLLKAQFFAPRTVFPAPLRGIFSLAKYVYRSKRTTGMGKEDVIQRKTKYVFLLKRLVKMALHHQHDGSMERDEEMQLKIQMEEQKREKLEERFEEEMIQLREENGKLQSMLSSAQQLINDIQSQKRGEETV